MARRPATSRLLSRPRIPSWGLGAPALLAALAVWASGCGYSAGFRLEEDGVNNISIEIVANDSFRQRLELPLTRQIQRELEARAQVEFAAPGHADAALRVRIRSAREHPLAEGARGVVAVGSLVLAVDAELTHRRTGKVLRKGRVADRGEFILPVGEEFADGIDKVCAKIARRVVLLLDPRIATLMALRGSEEPGRAREDDRDPFEREGDEAQIRPEKERSLDS